MKWTAHLASVPAETPSDTMDISIEFKSDEGSSFVKGYHLHASNFPDIDSFKAMVQSELDRLNSFSDMRQQIIDYIGKDVLDPVVEEEVKAVQMERAEMKMAEAEKLADVVVEETPVEAKPVEEPPVEEMPVEKEIVREVVAEELGIKEG